MYGSAESSLAAIRGFVGLPDITCRHMSLQFAFAISYSSFRLPACEEWMNGGSTIISSRFDGSNFPIAIGTSPHTVIRI